MFTSNQVLEVSGRLLGVPDEPYLKASLLLALTLSDNLRFFEMPNTQTKCVYQITEDGRFCIGWATNSMDDWKEFPFGTDFQIDSVVRMVMEHLIKQEIKKDIWDGSYRHGFLMRVIPEYSNNKPDGIKNPMYGIVSFEPYTCFYSK